MRRLLALLLVLAACGGGGGDDAADTTTTTTSTTEAPAYPASIEPVPSAGCGTSTATAVRRERRTLQVAGEERWYLLSVPAAHDGEGPLPLVVEFHGLAQGAERAADTGRLDDLGELEGFVSVFPNGSGSPVRWNERLADAANADFELVTTVLDDLGEELCVDLARTYATGLSYGAIMSSAMACRFADRFAAIAPVAGLQRPDGCDPARPVPVLAFHGTADPILLFNGGIGDLGAALAGRPLALPDEPVDLEGEGYPAAVRAWAEANGCGEQSDERRTPNVVDRSYECPPEAEVGFVIIEGGGHTWPGSEAFEALEAIVGPTTDEVDATREGWAFFERHANPLATR